MKSGKLTTCVLRSIHDQVLNDPDADKYVSGVAMHWYLDELFPLPGAMDVVHNNFPDKFILYTEACTGAVTP